MVVPHIAKFSPLLLPYIIHWMHCKLHTGKSYTILVPIQNTGSTGKPSHRQHVGNKVKGTSNIRQMCDPIAIGAKVQYSIGV